MKKIFTSKVSTLPAPLPAVSNKARQNCLSQIVLGMVKSGKAQCHAIAEAIRLEADGTRAKSAGHRTGDFFRKAESDREALAASSH